MIWATADSRESRLPQADVCVKTGAPMAKRTVFANSFAVGKKSSWTLSVAGVNVSVVEPSPRLSKMLVADELVDVPELGLWAAGGIWGVDGTGLRITVKRTVAAAACGSGWPLVSPLSSARKTKLTGPTYP